MEVYFEILNSTNKLLTYNFVNFCLDISHITFKVNCKFRLSIDANIAYVPKCERKQISFCVQMFNGFVLKAVNKMNYNFFVVTTYDSLGIWFLRHLAK